MTAAKQAKKQQPAAQLGRDIMTAAKNGGEAPSNREVEIRGLVPQSGEQGEKKKRLEVHGRFHEDAILSVASPSKDEIKIIRQEHDEADPSSLIVAHIEIGEKAAKGAVHKFKVTDPSGQEDTATFTVIEVVENKDH